MSFYCKNIILFAIFISLIKKNIFCSDYVLKIFPPSPIIVANLSNNSGIYIEMFDNIKTFFDIVQIYENELNIIISNDVIINEPIYLYKNCSLQAINTIKMIFSNLGQFLIWSKIDFYLINFNITENTNNSNLLSFFDFSQANLVNFIVNLYLYNFILFHLFIFFFPYRIAGFFLIFIQIIQNFVFSQLKI